MSATCIEPYAGYIVEMWRRIGSEQHFRVYVERGIVSALLYKRAYQDGAKVASFFDRRQVA